MKTKSILVASFLVLISFNSCLSKKSGITENNVKYEFVNGSPKKKAPITPGDLAVVDYKFYLNDSLIFDAKAQNQNRDIQLTVMDTEKYGMFLNSIPVNALVMMHTGDSAIFKLSAKEFSDQTKQPMQDWMKENDTIIWQVKMVKFATKAQLQKERASLRKKSDNFLKSPGGLEYKFIELGKGGYVANSGDHAKLHVIFKIGDSVIINTQTMNNGEPAPNQLNNPGMDGDLMEGLLFMQEGDSTVFRIIVDTLHAKMNQQLQPWMKSGDYCTWEVRMVSLQSEEEMLKEKEAKEKEQIGKDDDIIKKYLADNGITNAQKTANGLYYVVTKEGNGVYPTKGQKVSVNYTGKLIDGTVFDSNVDPKFNHVEPFKVPIGVGNVIKGWDEGMMLFSKGGKGTLFIPSGLGYGANGAGGAIGPNAVLIFDIELLDIEQ